MDQYADRLVSRPFGLGSFPLPPPSQFALRRHLRHGAFESASFQYGLALSSLEAVLTFGLGLRHLLSSVCRWYCCIRRWRRQICCFVASLSFCLGMAYVDCGTLYGRWRRLFWWSAILLPLLAWLLGTQTTCGRLRAATRRTCTLRCALFSVGSCTHAGWHSATGRGLREKKRGRYTTQRKHVSVHVHGCTCMRNRLLTAAGDDWLNVAWPT